MLKDYFNPNLSDKYQMRIFEWLLRFPQCLQFSSYGLARAYRNSSDYKNVNVSIVLYYGTYYLMQKEQRRHFRYLLHAFERDDAWEKRLAKVDGVLDVSL